MLNFFFVKKGITKRAFQFYIIFYKSTAKKKGIKECKKKEAAKFIRQNNTKARTQGEITKDNR